MIFCMTGSDAGAAGALIGRGEPVNAWITARTPSRKPSGWYPPSSVRSTLPPQVRSAMERTRAARAPKPERDPAVLELQKAVANLTERLESVEVLNRFEERLARESVERQAPGPPRAMGPSRELE